MDKLTRTNPLVSAESTVHPSNQSHGHTIVYMSRQALDKQSPFSHEGVPELGIGCAVGRRLHRHVGGPHLRKAGDVVCTLKASKKSLPRWGCSQSGAAFELR